MDGQPVEGAPDLYATVSFFNQSGGGAPATGIVGPGGKYSLLTGTQATLPPGDYLISILVRKIHPPKTGGGMPISEQLSAEKYADPRQSGLQATVTPGSNALDFDVQSAPNS